jgi:hypothetical protein
MNKAQRVRARIAAAIPAPLDPPRPDTFDADRNARIFREVQDISLKNGLESYLISFQGTPVATLIFRITEKQCTAYATTFVNHSRVMWKSSARSVGYDRRTASLDGLTLPRVHVLTVQMGSYSDHQYSPTITLEDKHERWDKQLLTAGFQIWKTL